MTGTRQNLQTDEPIRVVDYDTRWPDLFTVEQQRLCRGLGIPESDIEHIGSTAVPGLEAKPIVDMMLGVRVYPPRVAQCELIKQMSYEDLGEAGVPRRRYFRLRATRMFNLHVVLREGRHWLANLALRDYLRTHPDARARYGALKRQAVASGHNTLLRYSKAKAQVMDDLVVQALEWSRVR